MLTINYLLKLIFKKNIIIFFLLFSIILNENSVFQKEKFVLYPIKLCLKNQPKFFHIFYKKKLTRLNPENLIKYF